ncbi:ATP-binding cassette domain-containing protein [Streptomyces cavourensis]
MLDARSFHPARTAVNHLRMPAKGAGLPVTRADEVLEQVGLTPVATARPKGFTLGMGQRLGLAAALLGEPDTLILDEPANGLDPQGIHWLREFPTRYATAGNSVLISSHLLAEVEAVADHLVVIGRGRLLADLPLTEFIRAFGLEAVLVRTSGTEGLARAVTEEGSDMTRNTSTRAITWVLGVGHMGDTAVTRKARHDRHVHPTSPCPFRCHRSASSGTLAHGRWWWQLRCSWRPDSPRALRATDSASPGTRSASLPSARPTGFRR